MKDKENIFTRKLEVFRTEIESAIQFFYADRAMNGVLAKDKYTLEIVNRTPLFWVTTAGALHTAFFITLGRIFDQVSNHNIDKILRTAQEHTIIFSKEALERRKRAGNANAAEWINEYMKSVYVPSAVDFRRLRKYVAKYRKIYETVYRDIRNKVIAHKQLSNVDDIHALYAKTNIAEMQKLLIFLNKLYHALWQLYHNGNKPVLRQMKYSAKRMIRAELPKWQSHHVQERIVADTVNFLKLLSNIPKEQLGRD
jgi:hypothetical protein